MKNIIITFITILFSIAGYSQKADSLRVYHKNTTAGILLKIVPASPLKWYEATQNGYTIERKVKGSDTYEQITTEPLLPASREDMEQQSQTDPVFKGLIRQLYDIESPLPENNDFPSVERKRQEMKGRAFLYFYLSCLSPKASASSGMQFSDENLKPNETYIYRITINGDDITEKTYEVTYTGETFHSVPELITQGEDKLVKLRWNHGKRKNQFIGYRVKKSTDLQEWEYLGNEPIIYNNNSENAQFNKGFIYESDSLEANYQPFYYKLIGIDFFGERNQSQKHETVMGIDLTPPNQPKNVTAEFVPGNMIKLTWNYKRISPSNDFQGFYIGTASSPNGNYKQVNEKILPQNARTFIYREPDLQGKNYFVVTAVDTAGNFKNSLPVYVPIPDTTPPAIPEILAGKADTSGVVTITWNMGNEKDLRGYRVYKANNKEHEFVQITRKPIRDTVFRDTIALKTLTKEVFYKAVAVDMMYNHSGFSKPAAVSRPDVVPPVKPQIKKVWVKNGEIHIDIIPSSSRDAEENILLMKNSEDSWQVAANLPVTERKYTMPFPANRAQVALALITRDESGLVSDTSEIRVAKTIRFYTLNPIQKLDGEAAENSQRINLQWNYQADKKEFFFVIYRGQQNGGLKMYDTVIGDEFSYSDNMVRKGETYHYAIRVKQESGKTSALSKSISIKLPDNE